MPTPCQVPIGLSALVLAIAFTATAAGQAVWSGLTFEFTKDPFADHTLPANQDAITDGVKLTRANTLGLFNFEEENTYETPESISLSPVGTEWATNVMPANSGLTVNASNWSELTFTTWSTAYGGQQGLAANIVGANSVLHLIEEDIYLDVEFTSWSVGFGGGGFSYLRAVPVPEPAAWVLTMFGWGLGFWRHQR